MILQWMMVIGLSIELGGVLNNKASNMLNVKFNKVRSRIQLYNYIQNIQLTIYRTINKLSLYK
jgi:hypothetical protein